MSSDNEDLVLRWQDSYNSRLLDALDDILAPDWLSNCWLEGVPKSVEAAKNLHRMIMEILPDIQYETRELFSVGDYVAQRYLGRGTHKGEFAGLTPTGREICWGGISHFRIRNRRIVEHWGYADDLGMLEQMGAGFPSSWLATRHH